MPETIERMYRVTRITCTAMFAIVGLMSYVIWFMFRSGVEREPLPLSFVMVFSLIGLAGVVAGPLLRARILRRGAEGSYVAGSARVMPLASQTPGSPDPAAGRLAALNVAAVVGMAGGEPATLGGFVLSFLSGSWIPLLVGGTVTVAYMLAMFPRRVVWERWVEQVGLGSRGDVPTPEPSVSA